MIQYDHNYLQHILKRGKLTYDINPESKLYNTTISSKVKELNNDEVRAFLNYQFDDNEFKYSFTSILYSFGTNSNWLPDQDKRKIIKDWLIEVLPINVAYAKTMFSDFLNYNRKGFNSSPILELVQNKELIEGIEILKFGLELSEEGIKIHRFDCDKVDCQFESDYYEKTDLLKSIIAQNSTEEEVINLQKIVWKGSQKQLGELFVQLKKNGWIDDFNNKTIKACFTESNSIDQVLKPFTNKKTKKDEYENIYSKKYKEHFYGIMKNEKHHK